MADDLRDRHAKVYLEEARELVGELEEGLLELEEAPGDAALVGRVFRALHTIKGSGAMFGFDNISGFTHSVENVFEHIREGRLGVTKPLIGLALKAADHIRRLISEAEGGLAVDEDEARDILDRLDAHLPAGLRADAPPGQGAPAAASAGAPYEEDAYFEDAGGVGGRAVTYRIRLRPGRETLRRGTNPMALIEELRGLGQCWIAAQLCDVPALDRMDPEQCYAYWDIILTTSRGLDEIRDVFIFIEDDSEIRISVIDEGSGYMEDSGYKRLGEILLERGDIGPEDIERVLREQRPIGRMLVERGLAEKTSVESALIEQREVKRTRQERMTQEAAASVRVPAARLDKLVDLVGELVTIQARLTQYSISRLDPELHGLSEVVERLVSELHDNAMSIRMVPIGALYSKFRRLVRDLSQDLGRDVRFITEGAETELDKNVIDRLNDPLVHLIRNCMDHGVEPPDVREAVGKERQATVRLTAAHSGPDVVIELSDDGAGVDLKAVRERAVARGLISPEAEPTEEDLMQMLFMPGFSTARSVTDVSGRGVGMDVVKRGIEALRGQIEMRSRKGVGTTIRLTLPLTLAIVDGLLVRLAGDSFVFPLSSVLECIELTEGDIRRAHGRHVINVRGEVVPYIRLRERFGIKGDRPPIEQVVVTQIEGHRVGFVADAVIGGHQTVIKSLGKTLKHVRGVSGATILGNGSVALILDIARLYEQAGIEEAARTGSS